MGYEYVREGKAIKEKTEDEKKSEFIMSILKTKNDLNNARNNYEFAEDDLIDYFLYEIKANQAKLDYLLNKAKKSGLEIDLVDSFLLKNNRAI